MKCKECSFDDQKPIGNALHNIKKVAKGKVKLIENSWLMLFHENKHKVHKMFEFKRMVKK